LFYIIFKKLNIIFLKSVFLNDDVSINVKKNIKNYQKIKNRVSSSFQNQKKTPGTLPGLKPLNNFSYSSQNGKCNE